MSYLYTALVITTIVGLWYRTSRNLKAQGRGWFMQHWIGGSISCTVGVMQAFMFSSESLIWNGLAVAVTVGALGLAASPLPKQPQ